VSELTATLDRNIVIEIGDVSVRVRTGDPAFLQLLEKRYTGFVNHRIYAEFESDVYLTPPGNGGADADQRMLQR